MKVVAIIQSRLGSTRLPGKALMLLDGKPMIRHVLDRAATIKGVDRVVLAVPADDLDSYKGLWPDVYGGSKYDVLKRYYQCAKAYQAEIIIRLTGDCPLIAPDFAQRALSEFMKTNATYIAMCQPYSLVADGWDVEVFSNELLCEAAFKANDHEREHVVTWMRTHVPVVGFVVPDTTALKCSVDTLLDFNRVQLIIDRLNNKADYSHTATWEAWERAGRP